MMKRSLLFGLTALVACTQTLPKEATRYSVDGSRSVIDYSVRGNPDYKYSRMTRCVLAEDNGQAVALFTRDKSTVECPAFGGYAKQVALKQLTDEQAEALYRFVVGEGDTTKMVKLFFP